MGMQSPPQSEPGPESDAGETSLQLPPLPPRPPRKGNVFGKLGLLIWKNLLLRRRHYILTALELIFPLLLAGALVGIHQTRPPGERSSLKIQYQDKALNSSTCWSTKWKDVKEKDESCRMTLAHTPGNDLTVKTPGNIVWNPIKSLQEITEKVPGYSWNQLQNRKETQGIVQFDSNLATVKDQGGTFSYSVRFLNPRDFGSQDLSMAQRGVDDAIISRLSEDGASNKEWKLNFYKLVIGEDDDDWDKKSGRFIFSGFGMLVSSLLGSGFIFSIISILHGVLSEKETGIKELMKLSGLPNWMHWTAWTVNYLVIFTPAVSLFILMMFVGGETQFFWEASWSLVWLILWLHFLGVTIFFFWLSTFFSKPVIAISVGLIVWITTAIAPARILIDVYWSLPLPAKIGMSLVPNVPLVFAFWIFEIRENEGGAGWGNLFDTLGQDTLSLGIVLVMMILDIVLYSGLTLYFEAVLPSEYGVRRSPFFFFTRSFWGCETKTAPKVGQDPEISDDQGMKDRPGFEQEPQGREVGVDIQNLSKMFGGQAAVDGVSLRMFQGETFALLGHNGAGKTTLISCCVGMMAPSSGTAVINKFDIVREMNQVRQGIGICPQHNLLFEELTVDQHLKFFGKLKGGQNSAEAKKERLELLAKLQLTSNKDAMAKDLSGGQKRKLCLGIALIGNAKVIFLDEPTSGMDVGARQDIWKLLAAERQHRTIILTTHFMEEADVLGDRIGIMAHGKVQCCGTSSFLKKFYGSGYKLRMILSDGSEATKNGILSTVQTLVSSATFEETPNTPRDQIDVTLPTDDCPTSTFPKLFKSLHKRASFGIKTFGLSLTTMDEVFVKVDETKLELVPVPQTPSKENNPEEDKDKETTESPVAEGPKTLENEKPDQDDIEKRDQKNKGHAGGVSLILLQFRGFLFKRVHCSIREWKLVLIQAVVALFLVVIAIFLAKSKLSLLPRKVDKGPGVTFGIGNYPKDIITLFRDSRKDNKLAETEMRKAIGSSAQQLDDSGAFDTLLKKRFKKDGMTFDTKNLVAFEITENNAIGVYYRDKAVTLALNMAANLKLYLATGGNNGKIVHLQIKELPPILPFEERDLAGYADGEDIIVSVVTILTIFISLGLAILASSFLVAPITEKICGAKQLQLMTGASPAIYWGAAFLWDLVLMAAVSLGVVLLFVIVDWKEDHFGIREGFGFLFLILVTFAYAALPFCYIFSLLFSRVSFGFVTLLAIHLLSAAIGVFPIIIASGSLDLLFILVGFPFPASGLTFALSKYFKIALKRSRCTLLPSNREALLCTGNDLGVAKKFGVAHCCSEWLILGLAGQISMIIPVLENCRTPKCVKKFSYMTWKERVVNEKGVASEVGGLGQVLLFLFITGTIYHVILFLWEVWIGPMWQNRGTNYPTDEEDREQNKSEDVEEEAQRVIDLVNQKQVEEDALVLLNFSRNYGKFAAVKDVNFGLHHGECFGLLGVNGAGKTTTFRMLTGDESRTSGNAYASKCDLKSSRRKFLSKIGYCPQFDGIIGVLTGLEMVALFARLRGVREVNKESKEWMERVGLTESENVECGKYSGGMKRRLSAALALVGEPDILLLDEPTTGVDPVSRREFWKVVLSTKAEGRAIILTSHSMDEIAACCTRLAIMVNGELQCLGGVEYLKDKFAQGFTLDLKLTSDPETEYGATGREYVSLAHDIAYQMNPCVRNYNHGISWQYHIQDPTIPWDVLFSKMEEIKYTYPTLIEDYSFSETTLEQVFLTFARKQEPPPAKLGVGCCTSFRKLLQPGDESICRKLCGLCGICDSPDEDEDEVMPQRVGTGFRID